MTTVQNGSTVTLHYKGTLNDGTTFDSSFERNEPMTVTTGNGNLIAGFVELVKSPLGPDAIGKGGRVAAGLDLLGKVFFCSCHHSSASPQ